MDEESLTLLHQRNYQSCGALPWGFNHDDQHPRAATAKEQAARGLVASSMLLVLRQNASEFSVLDLYQQVLGNPVECRHYIKPLKFGSKTHRTDITRKEQSSQRDSKGAQGKFLEQRTNKSQQYLLFGSNSAVT